jgi:hypothetical protein
MIIIITERIRLHPTTVVRVVLEAVPEVSQGHPVAEIIN